MSWYFVHHPLNNPPPDRVRTVSQGILPRRKACGGRRERGEEFPELRAGSRKVLLPPNRTFLLPCITYITATAATRSFAGSVRFQGEERGRCTFTVPQQSTASVTPSSLLGDIDSCHVPLEFLKGWVNDPSFARVIVQYPHCCSSCASLSLCD